MKRSLMLIESPNKIETIGKFLKGFNIKIMSTVGHVRDLDDRAFNRMGFNEKNYEEIKWKIIENRHDVMQEINREADKCQEIYLSTDPDREGEAISWHIQSLLDEKNKKKCKRVVFNEITKSAIKEALANPRELDQNQIKSYLARKLLDRKIGFDLTSFTNKAVGGHSAGRVQSIALKFLKDRHLEIQQFVPEHWFNLKVILENDLEITLKQLSKDVKVDLHKSLNNSLINFLDEQQAQDFRKSLSKKYKLVSIEDPRSEKQSSPRAFKTSTLFSTAINRLNMSSNLVRSTAQRLYEGIEIDGESVSLITYPRTDRDDLSETFVEEAEDFVSKTYSPKYWKGSVKTSNKSKEADNSNLVQGAHEGIRPTYIEITPKSLEGKLDSRELGLYSLIWVRAVASLMSDALYENVLYKFENNNNLFTANSRTEIFDGYKKLVREYSSSSDSEALFPTMKAGSIYEEKHSEIKRADKKPPSLYTESSLVTALEEKGIGRPSTYASILNIVVNRQYAVKEDGKLSITDHGLQVSNALEKFFSTVMHYDYTKNMEDRLDDISKNKYDWKKFLDEIFGQFTNEFKLAEASANLVGRKCDCGQELVYRFSWRFKKRFISCSNYPECKYIESIAPTENKNSLETLDELCPECNHHLVKRKNKYNKFFIGCSDFPKCKYIKGNCENQTSEVVDRQCPNCNKNLVKRKNKYNKFFIGCSDYPNCKYIEHSANKGEVVYLNDSCPKCHNTLVQVIGKFGKAYIRCSDYPKCKYSVAMKNG